MIYLGTLHYTVGTSGSQDGYQALVPWVTACLVIQITKWRSIPRRSVELK